MLLPRSLASLKREISEKKWAEARRWAGDRVTAKKHKMPEKQRSSRAAAGCSKKLVARLYQAKTGALSHWAISAMDGEPDQREAWMVPS